MKQLKRALVISGGGSKGAFGGGVAEFLIKKEKNNYDIFVGSSTGSLLNPLLALGETKKVKSLYTTVKPRSIFDVSPFVLKKHKDGRRSIKINHINIVRQFLKKRPTFGESRNLKKLIVKNFSKSEFQTLKESGKEVIITVSNLSKNQVEYKSIRDYDYEDFCEWIWISCNLIPFMTLVEKDGCRYADGGLGSKVPIEEAIRRGAKIVDVIVLDTEEAYENNQPVNNVFSLMSELNTFMSERIARQNIRIGKLMATQNDVLLNFYYTPSELTQNSLVFESGQMEKWWQSGYDYAFRRSKSSGEVRSLDKG